MAPPVLFGFLPNDSFKLEVHGRRGLFWIGTGNGLLQRFEVQYKTPATWLAFCPGTQYRAGMLVCETHR
jgi:hypothetical protein